MTSPKSPNDEDPLDPTDPENAEDLRRLAGEPPLGETRAAFSLDEIVDEPDRGLTGTELERGYLEAGVDPTGGISGDVESIETLLEQERNSDETADPDIASEEGVPWVAPSDPVVVPDETNPEGLRVAAGFGSSSLDEPFDADHHGELLSSADEVTDRVREALRDDGQTTAYADSLQIDTEGDVVTLRGTVADIEDLEAVLAVASVVAGINEVVDELEIANV